MTTYSKPTTIPFAATTHNPPAAPLPRLRPTHLLAATSSQTLASVPSAGRNRFSLFSANEAIFHKCASSPITQSPNRRNDQRSTPDGKAHSPNGVQVSLR